MLLLEYGALRGPIVDPGRRELQDLPKLGFPVLGGTTAANTADGTGTHLGPAPKGLHAVVKLSKVPSGEYEGGRLPIVERERSRTRPFWAGVFPGAA